MARSIYAMRGTDMNVYSTDRQLIDAGAQPYCLGTSWMWYRRVDGEYDTTSVSVARIDSALRKVVERSEWGERKPLMMNIEAFDLRDDRRYAIGQLQRAAMRAKSFRPEYPIGFYRLIPERNYWTPVRQRYFDIRAWVDRNTANARDLVPHVDALYPSVYAFYEDRLSDWKVYAQANIEEAIRISAGKSVCPVLMPSYRGTQTIEPDKWRAMVEYVAGYGGVQSIMIHTSSTYVVDEQWRVPLMDSMAADR